ncbi:MAG: acyl-CoA dehydratase activase [Candidatus Neomarinimicrobiota bacterium]
MAMTAYLGIDLGSSYTKFAVTNGSGRLLHKDVIPTLSRDKMVFQDKLQGIRELYSVSRICTTGYGRFSFTGDINKTELICASQGASLLFPEHKCIIDIGGEDIKIVESAPGGEIINFYMNDKCSAGTGTFITEIAEKAELEIGEMSTLARAASGSKIINSFCTVFAKTEILGWKFTGVPIEEIALGIYLSIVSRIIKLPVRRNLPIILCGGVIAYHGYLGNLLSKEFGVKVKISPDSQYLVALGAAVLAGRN